MSLSKNEQALLRRIHVASENDPLKPEFPPHDPKFPATPTYRIKVPGFSNVWLKDESHNPTGTHKDRMAWEIVVTYKDFLLAKKSGQIKTPLPAMSLISSGSAAVAIQSQLRMHGLPDLRVLVDRKLNSATVRILEKLGCRIYFTDLKRKPFHWREILRLTDNPNGFDITSAEALDPTTRFYDWLSYEIINSSPDYCFMPFGTGNLFENVLNINKREVSTKHHDPRFKGKVQVLRRCNFLAATTNNPQSKADKLFSPHLPFVHYDEQWIRLYRCAGFCGPESNVHLIKEKYLEQAMKLAAAQGINCEPSGVAGLGLLLQLRPKIPKTKKILIVSTGKTTFL
ncbi:PLP-dependent lyase/thiolase [Patescibacteria group bacterium]|nr:PLP-dependent lyase/thiolase [Patescibacteria group bacterium]